MPCDHRRKPRYFPIQRRLERLQHVCSPDGFGVFSFSGKTIGTSRKGEPLTAAVAKRLIQIKGVLKWLHSARFCSETLPFVPIQTQTWNCKILSSQLFKMRTLERFDKEIRTPGWNKVNEEMLDTIYLATRRWKPPSKIQGNLCWISVIKHTACIPLSGGKNKNKTKNSRSPLQGGIPRGSFMSHICEDDD